MQVARCSGSCPGGCRIAGLLPRSRSFGRPPGRHTRPARSWIRPDEARTVVAKLDQLDHDDPVRMEFSPRVSSLAAALETSIQEKDDVERGVRLERLKLEKRRAAVNLLRVEVFGELLKLTRNKKIANRFFRAGSGTSKDDATDAPAPAPTGGAGSNSTMDP